MAKQKDNYLDYVPKHNSLFECRENKKGHVEVKVHNKGIFNRIAQLIARKPRYSYIELDDFGTFVWHSIDGVRSIYDIGQLVKEHFGDKAEPLYERLCYFIKLLHKNQFIVYMNKINKQINKYFKGDSVMRVLSELEPKNVFSFFEDICNIPHPSYKEEKISNYLVDFAKERKLEYYQDSLNNVIIIKEASKGYEDAAPIILQGHMDMVCEKTPDCDKNMDEDGLDLEVNGDFISAKGTTLGGDDGIAVAYALAILDDDSIAHPRLEFVCTVSEEVGMEGASSIDVSMLKGKKLLNMDSEEEGIMLASCAGGCSSRVTLKLDKNKVTGTKLSITLSGLTGGHSGVEIDKGRGNANVLMSRILRDVITDNNVYLAAFNGGRKDNAIPRECMAEIIVAADKTAEVKAAIENAAKEIKEEFATSDADLKCVVDISEGCSTEAVTYEDSTKAVSLIQALPNGIMRMSQDIDNLVETSLNLGVISLDESGICLRFSLRSSVGAALKNLKSQIKFISEAFRANAEFTGEYPAWEYKKDSKLRDDMVRIFEQMYGKKPTIEAIHAGVECGILAGKIEGLDCISMGPDIFDIHTTEEHLSISSTKRMYEYILNVIACK